MIQRESFVFYKSFRDAIETLPKDEQLKAYKFIAFFALDGEEPSENTTAAYGIFLMAKPLINANNKRYLNGCKGGRPKGAKTKRKPKRNLTKTKIKPNDNDNDNVNVNDNVNENEKEKSAYALKKKREQVRFHAPTLSEVKDYCTERGNGVDAQRFIDYYTSNGWKVGKNSMKDWKAAVRTWERNGLEPARPQAKKPENKELDPFEEYRGLAPEELEQLRSAGVLSDTGSADFSIAQETGLYYLLQKAGVAT